MVKDIIQRCRKNSIFIYTVFVIPFVLKLTHDADNLPF